MSKIDLLICDTDATIQILIANQANLLKTLKKVYGTPAVIVEAVEDELFNENHRLYKHYHAALEKAMQAGVLIALNRRTIGTYTNSDPHTTLTSIDTMGNRFHDYVQRGEAYTHAAAVVLRGHVLSNDAAAVRTLLGRRCQISQPVLRAYDIFTLFNQRGNLAAKDCDEIRKSLVGAGDTPHSSFSGCKFSEGIERFYPRVLDEDLPVLGSNTTRELGDENRILINAIPESNS